VSTTSDAIGTYYRYAFATPNNTTLFPDYPKLGVWPDAYYASFNGFMGNTFTGLIACAYERSAMLTGAAAAQVCFQQGFGVGSFLLADLDGATAPPSGSPNFYMSLGSNTLNLFRFHVDFTTPSHSSFTEPTVIPVAAFSEACNG